MLYFFEGARNSGKSFLSRKVSSLKGIPLFQYEFTKWFDELSLDSKSKESHSFAVGKETMLLQLNRDGMLGEGIIDRGIFSVLAWGVLENRISEKKAESQLDKIASSGLLNDTTFLFVYGNNPDNSPRYKDQWDNMEKHRDDEKRLIESFIEMTSTRVAGFRVHKIKNNFDDSTIKEVLKLF